MSQAPQHSLLIELLCEELPPKALKGLGEAFAELIAASLRAQSLAGAASVVTGYATPRRLAVHLTEIAGRAADAVLRHKLMPASVGLSSGAATPALLKKLAALGLAASDAARIQTEGEGKAATLYVQATQPGVTLAAGVQRALDEMLAKLPIPKVMSYQLADGWTSVKFVRPAHGLLVLHGSEVLPCELLGLQAGRETRGHRFEASQEVMALAHADHYESTLREQGGVVASFAQRRALIQAQLTQAAAREQLSVIEDEALLDEVTALVEAPNVLAGGFDADFLSVPPECLVLTMQANQKYFPLRDAQGKLANRFLLVSNIRPQDARQVIEGNERVVRPRLADAKFFFDQDRKKTLAQRVPGLAKVVYHRQLGSQAERSARVQAIAHAIVKQLRMATHPFTQQAKDEFDVLDAKVQEAALLAKADLLTDMVGEFPELQGIMGGYYARHEGLRDGVALAIEDHYRPRFAGDALPRNHTGTILALADKLETLVGLFGIGQVPSGDKDPFALRRHALGVLRLLIEKGLPLDLNILIDEAGQSFGQLMADPGASGEKLKGFIYERIAGYLRERWGASAPEAEAVIAVRPPWGEIPKRLAAVRAFAQLPEAQALAAANTRVSNILKKSADAPQQPVDAALLKEPAERALADALAQVAPRAQAAGAAQDFTGALQALAALKAPVDAFFDAVMVNADDAALRANRLALLAQLRQTMNQVADISRLAG